MAYQYQLHEQAHNEYLDAYEWYELKQKGLGYRFMAAVGNKINKIAEHPEYYSKIRKDFRQAKVDDFPFTIVYEFFPRRRLIHIAAIHHSSRHPKSKFRQE